MAWTSIGGKGTAAGVARGTKISMTTNAIVTASAVLVLVVAKDNTATTNGSTTEVTAVTDASSNAWTKAGEYCNAGGAASAGAVVAVYFSKVSTQLASGAGITATFAASCNAAAVSLHQFSIATGNQVRLPTAATAEASTTTPGALTIAGLSSAEYLFIRGQATERNDFGFTGTTNYTAIGTNFGNGGNTASSMQVAGEFRIFTGTGDTSNPGDSGAKDSASLYFALQEYTPSTLVYTLPLTGVGG